MLLALIISCTVALSSCQLGGFSKNTDTDFMPKAWAAAVQLNQNTSTDGYHLIPIKVLKARTQVVGGLNHEFQVVFGESDCKKEETKATELSASKCQLKDGARKEIYDISLWERAWEDFEQFTIKKVRNVLPNEQI